MPILEAGFINDDGKADPNQLILYGPTIQVSIGHFRDAGESSSVPKEDVYAHALVDTGATESCIDISLAQELELPIVDIVTISGSDGAKIHDVYIAQIHIADFGTQYGKFAGVDLDGGGQPHRALLGGLFYKIQ